MDAGADWPAARRLSAGGAPVRRKEVEAADWPLGPPEAPPRPAHWRPARRGGVAALPQFRALRSNAAAADKGAA